MQNPEFETSLSVLNHVSGHFTDASIHEAVIYTDNECDIHLEVVLSAYSMTSVSEFDSTHVLNILPNTETRDLNEWHAKLENAHKQIRLTQLYSFKNKNTPTPAQP